MSIAADRLRELLDYDVFSGVFSWKVSKANVRVGSIAGCVNPNGYLMIGVDGRLYRAHRLAWLYMTGEWPVDDIDHIDRVRSNNAWNNLRAATRQQNLSNKGIDQRNKSGLKGVCWDKHRDKWAAYIKVNSRSIGLGRFATKEEAHSAYVSAANKYFGEFARSA